MNAKTTLLTIFGTVVALLGALWLVQGLGIVQIGPILCVADCEPIAGRSVRWAVAGAIALLVGIVIARAGLRRVNR
ncbi:hypothetical protein C481_08983 [Natrialba asiatica DSM 12278]|uniref:Uncharacterized protein n=1 Tax=Natrialba asiatica (strain ATCC 700177 / DSM 12278 / JCM 9576 / FERM P-10747 / NBRC 102637 / 172P1) TaxID=29540 RepID=M0ATF7_NATA1|nr:hypothetical protein C481_08983 [Natrialba asiatica DSM 12278]